MIYDEENDSQFETWANQNKDFLPAEVLEYFEKKQRYTPSHLKRTSQDKAKDHSCPAKVDVQTISCIKNRNAPQSA